MYLSAKFPVGAARAGMRVLMSRYQKTLVICAPVLRDQWQRVAHTIEDIHNRFPPDVTVMTRDEFLIIQPILIEYKLIVIDDYPESRNAPRRRFDGVSYIGYIKENILTNNIDILVLE